MEFTAIVQHFYPQREKYLPRIIESIWKAEPKEIILWNNGDVLDLKSEHVTEIHSDRNTLLGRYAAILIAETEYVYVQDDDLVVSPDTIHDLIVELDKNPMWLHGIKGMNLAREGSHPYTAGHAQMGVCDVLLGRAWVASKKAVACFIQYCMVNNLNPGCADDILLSRTIPMGCFAVASPQYEDLDEEGVGLCHQAGHLDERNKMARRLVLEGR